MPSVRSVRAAPRERAPLSRATSLRPLLLAAGVAVGSARSSAQQPPPPPPPPPREAPAAQPIAGPPVVQFGNGTDFVLYRPMTYRVGESTDSVVVPAGFVTDYASIPRFAQLGISKMGAHMLPAIVHDYLYWTRACTRRQADGIFRLAMIEMQVPSVSRQAMYRAVDVGGQSAWDSNGQQRAAGLTRIVPLDRGLREPGRLETWSAYQRFLLASGATAAREPTPVITPGLCARGLSADVPDR